MEYFNTELGTTVPTITAGDLIENEIFLNARNTWAAAAESSARTVNLPPASAFVDGVVIKREAWGDVATAVPATTISSTSNGSHTVLIGVSKIMLNWVVGGGGGGGCGSEVGNGGGGGGGGSGGFAHYVEIPVRLNDKLTWTMGLGGAGGSPGRNSDAGVVSDGKDGTDTIVMLNGQEILRASGGKGGLRSTNQQGLTLTTPGGAGGSPNGLTGQVGPAGNNDHASSYGGGGAPGPLQGCYGGAGGSTQGGDAITGGSAGKAGVGAGSGGGGGGSDDRSGLRFWAGGRGQVGYIEFTYPSQGQVGGTPAQNNGGYNTTAPLTGTGGGGYTGGGGRFGDENGTDSFYL